MNLDNSINIIYKVFKFGVVILHIIMEGTVSQIFNLGPSSFPDFWYKMRTKT